MLMKYSIILPYYDRPQLRDTLRSIYNHYNSRDDYEVIIVVDSKNTGDKSVQLRSILKEFKRLEIVTISDPVKSYNPSTKYNRGVAISRGEFIVITNPEIFHEVDILAGLDNEFDKDNGCYVICSCRSVIYDRNKFESYRDYKNYRLNPEFQFCESWYQHSLYRNEMFHFCSAMSKKTYLKIGGFDERFRNGIGFEDNNFIHRVKVNSVPIILRDDLITLHIEHDKSYIAGHEELIEINRGIFVKQLAENNFY